MHHQVQLVFGLVLVAFLTTACEPTPAPEVEAEQPEKADTVTGQREPFAISPDGGPAVWFLGSLASSQGDGRRIRGTLGCDCCHWPAWVRAISTYPSS